MYVRRFLEPVIEQSLAQTPITVIEGARAVGKTRLLSALRETGRIATVHSLTDPSTFAAASSNPRSWLRQLSSYAAIDEAQLLPDLPLALKGLMDERADDVHIVLTGSAAISRTGLGGTDPLARRVARFTLEPLTEAELHAGQDASVWSLVDQLFDGHPYAGATNPADLDWQIAAQRGGLPRYRINLADRSTVAVHQRVRQDIDSLLTDHVLPGERWDFRTVHDVLTHLLKNPCGELNVSAISQSLQIHRQTVDRYIDILERRFLVRELPNFRQPKKGSSRASAKSCPTDVALSSAALMLSDQTLVDSTTRGGLFEAHVVQQIRAHAAWSDVEANLFHWREHRNGRTDEVDLVLRDSLGRLVAVEIKSTGNVTSGHFKGIRSFRRAYPETFHRGFVIYAGNAAIPFDDGLWALPVKALSDLLMWQSAAGSPLVVAPPRDQQPLTTAPPPEQDTMTSVAEARLFISYTHQDQNSSVGGDIRRFANDVVEAMDALYGRTITKFLDIQDGNWGESLWGRLEQELEATTFLLPFITPRYLKSKGCRQEFSTFAEAAERANSEQLLLPLIWIMPPRFDETAKTDLVAKSVMERRYLNVTAARRADPGSAEYSRLVEQVAAALEAVIEEREQRRDDGDHAAAAPEQRADEAGLDEHLAAAEEMMPLVEDGLHTFMRDFEELGHEMQNSLMTVQAQTPSQLRAALVRASKRLDPKAAKLSASSDSATGRWKDLMLVLNHVTQSTAALSDDDLPASVTQPLGDMADQLAGLETEELESIAAQMPRMSSALTPTAKALASAAGTIRSMEESIRSWLGRVGTD